jgi:hypothetical protein
VNCVSDAKVELQIRGLGVDPQRCARAHLESFGTVDLGCEKRYGLM